jgi:hypothetical protein
MVQDMTDHNYGIVPHLPHANEYPDEPLMAPVNHAMAGDAVYGPNLMVANHNYLEEHRMEMASKYLIVINNLGRQYLIVINNQQCHAASTFFNQKKTTTRT